MVSSAFACIGLGAVLFSGSVGLSDTAAEGPKYVLEQRSSEIPMPAGILTTEWNLAQWQNGLLVLRAAPGPTTNKELTNLVAADRSGKILFRNTVWIADAAAVQTIGSAVSKDHLVAVSGFASSPSMAEKDFVQEIRPDGSVLRVIQTGNFLAFNLAYDAKGDLWMAGSPLAEGSSWPSHNVLRRYRQGELQAEYLPYEEFQKRYEATTSHKSHPAMHGSEGRAFLLPLREGVGLWSPGTHEWIEIGTDGVVQGRWQAAVPKPSSSGSVTGPTTNRPTIMKLYGLAVTTSGEVIASVWEKGVRNGMYRLDKATSSWQEIAVKTDDPNSIGYVAGADGESVVYRDNAGLGGWSVSPLVQK
jgi:hypothetical protein